MNGPDDRDELLAKLQAIDEKPAPTPHPQSSSPPPAQASAAKDDSLDSFLAELDEVDRKTQHLKPKPANQPKPATRPRTAPAPQAKSPQPPAKSPQPQSKPPKPRTTHPPIPKALEQLALFAKEKLEARAQERLQRQQRVQQEDKAKAWLSQLDPYSDDGFWFEQFAENYESRLQAAIDFLDPKRSSKRQ